MRFTSSLLLSLLLSSCIFAQANREIFGLQGQFGLTDKNEAAIQMAPLDDGNRLLLVGRKQLQLWDVPRAKLIDSSSHRITGYWTGGFLMRLVSFPKPANFPLAMNEDRMKVSPDGTTGIIITKVDPQSKSTDVAAIVWNLRTGDSVGSLMRAGRPIRDAEFSKDGSTIMTIHGELKDTELAFWDAKTLSHRNSILVKNLSFQYMSPDGEHIFVSSAKANKWLDVTVMSYDPSNGIELLNTRTGKIEKTFADGAAKFRSTTLISPDNKYAIARTDNKVVVWETAGDGTPKYRIEQRTARINHGLMGISQDSRYLLTQTKNEALVYELGSGTLYKRFPIREEYITSFSPDSRFVIMEGDGWRAAYDLEKEKISFTYALKTESRQRENEANEEWEVERALISPDGKSMMIDGKTDVRIYDLLTGDLVQTLVDPQRARYDDKGKLKNGGLDTGGPAGWLASGNSIYVSGADGRSFYLWNKK
jgi:uncharacterized phage-like protein YoqJ